MTEHPRPHLNRSCFVLGPHRSGTTIVSKAIAASGEFVFLTAADIVAFHQGVDRVGTTLGELVQREATRVIDDVRLSEDLPEEYGFVLPGRRLTEESAPLLDSLYRELAAKRGSEKMALLRNPWDLSRAALIHRVFPRASFVFVLRDPVSTINSQLQAMRALFAAPSEYHGLLDLQYRRIVRRKGLFAFYRFVTSRGRMVDRLLKGFVRTTDRLILDLPRLPQDRWTVVKYEDLIRDPGKELGRVFGFLGLPPGEIPKPANEIRPSGRALDPHVEARAPKIRERTRSFRETFGY
ncbi:MAG: sulfotransferase family protein [Gemmatimonadota bacterium]